MQKLIMKFYKMILLFQAKRHKKRLAKLHAKIKSGQEFSENRTKKYASLNGVDLKISAEDQQKKKKMEFYLKKVVKKAHNNPHYLLNFIKQKGTHIYKIPFADDILRFIGEEEGLITPLKGFKAAYLTFFINIITAKTIKISFKTDEMFVLRDMEISPYYMLHQFYKWYSLRMNFPGYDFKTQEKFKKFYKTLSPNMINMSSMGEVYSLKEAIARDIEASDFVLELVKGSEGAKNALDKMQTDSGASV